MEKSLTGSEEFDLDSEGFVRRRIKDLEDFQSYLDGLIYPLDVEEAAPILKAVRDMKWTLGVLEKSIESKLVEAMPKKKVSIEGLGTLERMTGNTRKNWDHRLLASMIAGRAVVDEATGEILAPKEAAERAKDLLLEAAAISYWRAGVLREKFGLDPDRYCDSEKSKPTVIIR